MHTTGIYEIRNLVNGKRYVGSAVRFPNRKRQHLQSLARGDHHAIALQRAWAMYGPDAFEFKPLLICGKENLLMYEQILLDAMKPEYNSANIAGSMLGYKHRPESRAKMSASRPKDFSPMTGKRHTPETKAKISAARKGKGGGTRTPERLKKIADAMRATKSQLTEEKVRQGKALRASGATIQNVADACGCTFHAAYDFIRGRTYQWVV